ncbi:sulfite exporter TauE/SafE family protein [Clostridium sp. WILCCON 0269]|uniref:Sulfite exporter TauE/SafE family protein n=1 Tax=Candidatus Clostridium eludens TaxID=3381663 RepID=A0ABW8SNL9_9CLOT
MDNHLLLFLKDLFYLKYLPSLGNNASFSLIFLFGILTSIHCIGMCGGIVLTQCINRNEAKIVSKKLSKNTFLPIAIYNIGRVISYTIIGGVVGGIGQVLTLSGIFKGIIPIIGGIFMIIMAINLLGIFPVLRYLNISMPKFVVNRIVEKNSSTSPLIVGLLTGLMPCGPLQMIQLYALSTRSAIYGAASAFIFTLGTIPGLFAFGTFSAIISKKFSRYILKFSAALVIVLGIVMIGRGLALTGVVFPAFLDSNSKTNNYTASVVQGNIQTVTTSIGQDYFPPIQVTKGIKVKWTINVDKSVYSDCNNAIRIPVYNIKKKFVIGNNTVEFTPDREGEFIYTCWMGMIKSKIKVVPNGGLKKVSNSSSLTSSTKQVADSSTQVSKSTSQKENSAVSSTKNENNVSMSNTVNDVGNSDNKPESILEWFKDKLTPGGNESAKRQQKTQTWVGWIFDRDCIGINPVKHTKACNIMGSCYASGLGIIPYIEGKSFDTYKAMRDFVVFDGESKIVAKSFIESLPENWRTNITIKVTGYPVNNIPTNKDETNVPEEDSSKVDHYLSGIHITSIEAYYIEGISTNKLPSPNIIFPKK